MKTHNIKCPKCKGGITKLIIGKVTITGFTINVKKCDKCGYKYRNKDYDNLFKEAAKMI